MICLFLLKIRAKKTDREIDRHIERDRENEKERDIEGDREVRTEREREMIDCQTAVYL